MEQRRNFLKGAGIIGAFAVGVASYRQVKDMANEHKDISHLAPPKEAITIQINGAYGEKPKPQSNGNFIFAPMNPEITHKVSMTVGKDNRLWMKIGDEWHRVAIES
jgi:hypothetical protein